MRRKAFTAFDGLVVGSLLVANWVLIGKPSVEGPPTAVEVVSAEGTSTVPFGGTRTLELKGPLGVTVVKLDPEGVRVVSSPCPLQLCVRSSKAKRPGQVLVCLPNHVAVRVLGRGGERDVDAVSR